MRGLLIICSIAFAEDVIVNGVDAEDVEVDQTLTGSARRLKKSNKYEEAARAAMEYTNFKSPLADIVRKNGDINELLRSELHDKQPEGIVSAFTHGELQGHALNEEVEQVNSRKAPKKIRHPDNIDGQQYATLPTIFNGNPAFWHLGSQPSEYPFEPLMLPLGTQGLQNPLRPGFGTAFNVPERIIAPSQRAEFVARRAQPPTKQLIAEVGALPLAQRAAWIESPTGDALLRRTQNGEYLSPLARAAITDRSYIDNYVPMTTEQFTYAPHRDYNIGLVLPGDRDAQFSITETPLGTRDYTTGLPISYRAELLPAYETEVINSSPYGIDVVSPTETELVQTPWGTTELVPLAYTTEFGEAPLINSQLKRGTRHLPTTSGLWLGETYPEALRGRFGGLREPSVALPEFPILRDTLRERFNVELLEE